MLPLHSLAAKLTLAFLLIGMIGAALVALLVGVRTRSEFDRFLSTHDQAVLVDGLGSYYASRGSWEGVGEMLARTPPLDFYSRRVVLVDASRTVVLGSRRYPSGQQVPAEAVAAGTPIEVQGRTAGFVLLDFPNGNDDSPVGSRPADLAFLRQVAWASALSAAIAALSALVVGWLIARTLTRPLRELTAATQAMAGGQLGQRVMVRSSDEIGELARSFNQMSTDLSRASQLRKQMTADLAHDLRTPLSILRGYTEGLKDGRLSGTETLYEIMHDEVEHLQRLVEDLRILSLADAGELSLNRRAVDPAALLERTALAYIVEAEEHGIVLELAPHGALSSILVDTDRMTQVLNNLVSNALRYTAQGTITLAATDDGHQVQLCVRDSGSGIAAEDLPFIFDRFYRADKARQRTNSNASGLGLAIAKAIVEAHRGTIEVESTLGQGTAFTIRLPLAGAMERSSEAAMR